MLYCCITIDYLSQLERSGVREVGAFIEELRTVAVAFGATAGTRRTPLMFTFPSGGMFDGIQTAEALTRMVSAFSRYEPFLRGGSLTVHDTTSGEDALSFASSIRYKDCAAYIYAFSPQAREALAQYFDVQEDAWTPPFHASSLGDADASLLFDRPRLAATLSKTIARLERRGPRLVHLEAGCGVRSIEALSRAVGLPRDRALALDGARTRPLPFSPLVEVVAAHTAAGGFSPALPGNEVSAFDFVAASSFSGGAPESVSKGCAAYLDSWLDEFGSKGGIVACDDPARFSEEVLELVARRLTEGRGSERYVSIADEGLIDRWSGPWAARVPAGLADADDRPAMTEAALGSTTGRTRDALDARFRSIAGIGMEADDRYGLSVLLRILPHEASLYLYTLAIIENELSAAELSEFVGRLGLQPQGELLLRGLLSRAGLVEPLSSRTPIEPVHPALIAREIGPEAVDAIQERFSRYLIELYRAGRIHPSIGFLRRVGEQPTEERLVYDCVFEEIMRPDRPRLGEPTFLSASSACVYRFWSALSARDRLACETAAVAADDRITGPRAKTVRALVHAELAYASGDPERASKSAREAMLALGKGAPPKLEARSQRMMGLSALALDRHAEAADYLTNAQELSESAGDEYERMMAAYTKAIVEFLAGALVRSLKALTCAEESAARLFRMDIRAAIEALRGRIDLELGSYDEAARRFSSLSELAERYSISGAGQRAAIWRARALSYSGEFDEAVSLLEMELQDAEARVFRGELEILRGRPRDARTWLEAPEEPLPRPFDPPDSISWDSLFSEFEGRCIGFDAANTPLAVFRTALALFARGLDERNPDCAVDLHALTRSEHGSKNDPGMGLYSFFCYLLEERLQDPPVDKQTVLSRSFKILQQRAGRIENRTQRALYMEKNTWNKRLIEAARIHKFI